MSNFPWIEPNDLLVALEESLKLQSHYADLLNAYDGGQRMRFEIAADWVTRLQVTGTLKPITPAQMLAGRELVVLLDEGQRQMNILALARLSIERPGWLDALELLALRMDNEVEGRPEMFTRLRKLYADEAEKS